MTLVDFGDRDEPTHAIRTRSRSGVEDWDAEGGVAVENRVVDTVLEYGNAVHLCLDEALLADTAPGRLSTARERFDRPDACRRRLRNESPEYRARLPDDIDAVQSCLALEPGDTGGWLARLHGIAALAVVTPDSWLYRSVPHHAHIRELNVDPVDAVLEEVTATLESARWSAVVPTGPLVSWTDDTSRYELRWHALRRRRRGWDRDQSQGQNRDRDSNPWAVFDLERLRRVRPIPERGELRLRWHSGVRGTDSPIRRAVAGVIDRLAADPPTRVVTSETATVEEIASTLRELRAQFEYDYTFEGQNRAPEP
ncbi:hypothetical protein [Halobiforma nitratireducens]|uniref:Uncharacterized protein n=1 Tax=Halobiforma nitratireducens JCM 10879 TaxID=1227454 RepID=M0LZY1_9EURY|nr:hypothetical protein [Halobiforma nitratireducens]EMA39112.1 hypothetical protein C446_08978 [Halobiforma nitratireducens JCM 10879]